jgi:hypothetical protein
MIIPLHIAQKLSLLLRGITIPASSAKHAVIDELVAEGIIDRKGRIKKTLHLQNSNSLKTYLQNKFAINDIELYIQVNKQEEVSRADLVSVSADSKLKNVRTFKGFLVNCYTPIHAKLNNKPIVINPDEGVFNFIYDFENFIPDPEIMIVGVENAENFRHIDKQKHLFPDIIPLFISRYPQNQSKDVVKWLNIIPNHYLHFGDFDFAGIGIYFNEYKKHLKERASFYTPDNIDNLIKNFGNKSRYDGQKINFDSDSITENNIMELIAAIHLHKKGLDQEILIKTVSH